MKEDIVSHKLAVKLKELGFDELCYNFWSLEPDGKPFIITSTLGNIRSSDLKGRDVTAPFLWQAQKWLREVKGIDIEVTTVLRNPTKKTRYYMANLAYFSKDIDGNDCGNYIRAGIDIYSYEKALELGISEALELLTDKP